MLVEATVRIRTYCLCTVPTVPHGNCKSAGSEREFKRGASTPRARHEWPTTDDERIWTDRPVTTCRSLYSRTFWSSAAGAARCRVCIPFQIQRPMHSCTRLVSGADDRGRRLLAPAVRVRRYVRAFKMHACCCTTTPPAYYIRLNTNDVYSTHCVPHGINQNYKTS